MPLIEVSIGELLDKWTVLEIKSRFLSSEGQLRNVRSELDAISQRVEAIAADAGVRTLLDALLEVNLEIWRGMDQLDELERTQAPLDGYAAVALEVSRLNRRRAVLKRDINALSGSRFREEKSYF